MLIKRQLFAEDSGDNQGTSGDTTVDDSTTQDKDILSGPNSDADDKDDKSSSAADDKTDKDADADGDADNDGEKDGNDDQEGAPETYADFEMSEGVTIDENLLAEATPLFKEFGLNQEQAQKIVDLHAKQVQAGQESQIEAFNQMTEGWKQESINDKEFGGDKFDESINTAQTTIDKLGTPELGKLLKDHGVGNHPEVIRILVRMGEYLKEDVPGGAASQVTPEVSQLEALYPTKQS